MWKATGVALLSAALAWGCGGGSGDPTDIRTAPGPTAEGSVRVQLAGTGQGSVRFQDDTTCSAACVHDVPAGTALRLDALAAPGSRFAGWEGDCSGTGVCEPVAQGTVSVTARFELQQDATPAPPAPPAPAPEPNACEGLVPGGLGEGAAALMPAELPQDGCRSGISDEGGTFALTFESGTGPTVPTTAFFVAAGGGATQVGDLSLGGDEGGYAVFAYPRGFGVYSANDTSAFRNLTTFSAAGARTREEPISRGFSGCAALPRGEFQNSRSASLSVDAAPRAGVSEHRLGAALTARGRSRRPAKA